MGQMDTGLEMGTSEQCFNTIAAYVPRRSLCAARDITMHVQARLACSSRGGRSWYYASKAFMSSWVSQAQA